jgi:hypothetical protein
VLYRFIRITNKPSFPNVRRYILAVHDESIQLQLRINRLTAILYEFSSVHLIKRFRNLKLCFVSNCKLLKIILLCSASPPASIWLVLYLLLCHHAIKILPCGVVPTMPEYAILQAMRLPFCIAVINFELHIMQAYQYGNKVY